MYMYIGKFCVNSVNRQPSAEICQKSMPLACVLWSLPYFPINLLVWLVYSYELRPLTN